MRCTVEKKDDILNVKWKPVETMRQWHQNGMTAGAVVWLWIGFDHFFCVKVKCHWQTLLVSSIKQAHWPCGLIICLEVENLWTHTEDGKLYAVDCIIAFRVECANWPCVLVFKSAHNTWQSLVKCICIQSHTNECNLDVECKFHTVTQQIISIISKINQSTSCISSVDVLCSGYIVWMPHESIPGEMFWTCPCRRRPVATLRTHWREYFSWLSLEHLKVSVTMEWRVWAFMLRQPGPR